MSVLFGWDIRVIIIITSITVISYAFIGGILGGHLDRRLSGYCPDGRNGGLCVDRDFGTQGGPSGMFKIAIEHDKFSLGSFGGSLTQSTFWVT
jgi:SSS family solute:Na+ symporter